MKVITVANQKGGIGKTTTAGAIESILSARGYKTLIIDADMQCNTSDTYRAQIKDHETIYDVIVSEDRIPLSSAIQTTECGDIVAADNLLTRAEGILKDDVAEGLFRLKEAIKELEGYDYVIIDTNPVVNMLLYNCLVAADYVIIPVTADRYGLAGLRQLYDTIKQMQKRPNPNLKIAGLLVVEYDKRLNFEKATYQDLKNVAENIFGSKLYDTTIRKSVKVREAQAKQIPLIRYAPACTTELDYEDFVDELLNDMEKEE